MFQSLQWITNPLVGTLLRFREEEIAFLGDIDSMFYQVRPEDTSFLRSLWWNDGNSSSNVVEFQMVVHLFGVTSSPTVPTFTFEKLLKIGQDISVMRQLRVFLKIFKWMIVSSFGTIWGFPIW